MSSSATAPSPPVNLKDRIAALQQRSVSPPAQRPPDTDLPAPKTTSHNGQRKALQDRIAKFERKGGIPVPRGSFSMGAPSVGDKSTKSRELYANRIPGYNRIPSGPPMSRSGTPTSNSPPGTPSGRKRCVSMSDKDRSKSLYSDTSDVPDLPPLPTSSTSPPSPTLSTSPPSFIPRSPRRNSLAVQTGGRRAASSTDVFGEYTSLDGSALQTSPAEASPAVSALPSTPTKPVEAEEKSDLPTPAIVISPSSAVEPMPPVNQSKIEQPQRSESSPDGLGSQQAAKAAVVAAAPLSQVEGNVSLPEILAKSDRRRPEAKAVKQPAKISDVSSSVIDTDNAASVSSARESSDQPTPPLLTLNSSIIPEVRVPSEPSSPALGDVSVGDIFLAHRVSPPTSRAVPIVVPASMALPSPAPPVISRQLPIERKDKAESNPGSVALSDPQNTASATQSKAVPAPEKPAFTAVVHRKVVESNSHPEPSFNLAPSTPQASRAAARSSTLFGKTPFSPGYGELASLLENAALLEQRLSDGGLPDDSFRLSPVKENGQDLFTEFLGGLSSSSEKSTSKKETAPQPKTSPKPLFSSYGSLQLSPPVTPGRMSFHTVSSGEGVSEVILEEGGQDSVPPTPPPKSPSVRYLSGMRKLASSASHMKPSYIIPGAYSRNSISASSELSSDDSVFVSTPADIPAESPSQENVPKRSGSGLGLAWPSMTRKKSGSSIGSVRSNKFTDRILNRNRTKSGASAIESPGRTSANYRDGSHGRQPSLATLDLPPSISLQDDFNSSLTSEGSLSFLSQRSDVSSSPSTPHMFDRDLFDAFPSVPQSIPSIPSARQSSDSRLLYPASQATRARSISPSDLQPATNTSSRASSDRAYPHGGRSATLPVRRSHA